MRQVRRGLVLRYVDVVPGDSYTFADSSRAATRLELLAAVFRPATSRFLSSLSPGHQRLAVDLGCGPGHTTVLIAELIAPDRLFGVDASPAFVQEAAQRVASRGEVLCGDVLALPAQITNADLIFARFLLTHLPEPTQAVDRWLDRLAPGGVLAVQEVEAITTDEPMLARYLDLQRQMLQASGHVLEVGPQLAEIRPTAQIRHDNVARLQPPVATAARMFAMNFESWAPRPEVAALADRREREEIREGLAALAAGTPTSAQITWQLREIVLEQPPEAGSP